MPTQTSFSELEYAGKKKLTRRDRFLAEIEAGTPWRKLVAVIEPGHSEGQVSGHSEGQVLPFAIPKPDS